MKLKEVVDKGKDTCPLCAYIDYFIKNPVPKPEIKPPIETRFLDDEKKEKMNNVVS